MGFPFLDFDLARHREPMRELPVLVSRQVVLQWFRLALVMWLQVVVLGRLTPRQMKTQPSPYSPTTLANVDPNPLCSNIYSVGERLILLWLNHNYEQQRKTVWKDCSNGERWGMEGRKGGRKGSPVQYFWVALLQLFLGGNLLFGGKTNLLVEIIFLVPIFLGDELFFWGN